MACVYKHTFPNGAIYIGITDMKPEDRWLNGWGYKTCPLMFNAILKYGWDNVKHEILLDDLDIETARQIESCQIALHSAINTILYNIQSIPAQMLAQNNAQYIDTNTIKLPKSAQHPQNTTIKRTNLKDYIVPLTEKPYYEHSVPIDVYTLDGTFICTYPSAKIAAEELGVNHGDLISCCKGVKADGKAKYQVKGYIFRYGKVE